ncbi:putative transposase [Thioploca ingrica]|uniref:Putative transposase n=1 Tax=Thioploca ingrica TaxID=40754 RepID=A0A090BUM3_9GAMM|nr:putative transposase [Thioploca ingrica]
MVAHDESYKLLFSHPQMVEDLLRGFVHEPWVAELDFTTLEAVKSSFVSSNLKRRDEDVIWRVRWQQRWLYLYILLAFQATPQPFMGIRVAVYVGLFYQDLIKEQKLTSQDQLPPVIPIVLYNGATRWSAPTATHDLIESVAGLEQYQLQIEYLLLDEGTYSETQLAPLHNLVAALFRLENSRTEPDLQRVLESLIEWLAQDEQDSLRQAFIQWLKWVLLPRRLPNVAIPEVKTLQEMKTMLAETVQQWYAQAEQQGWQQGWQQGQQEGRLEGWQQGQQEGWQQGVLAGEIRGEIRGETRGKAILLLQLLASRFGSVPTELEQQIYTLPAEQLSQCVIRLWSAPCIEDVLPKQSPP